MNRFLTFVAASAALLTATACVGAIPDTRPDQAEWLDEAVIETRSAEPPATVPARYLGTNELAELIAAERRLLARGAVIRVEARNRQAPPGDDATAFAAEARERGAPPQ